MNPPLREFIGGQPVHWDRLGEFATRGVDISTLKAGLGAAARSPKEVLSLLTESQMEKVATIWVVR